jgi:hypothetical protein
VHEACLRVAFVIGHARSPALPPSLSRSICRHRLARSLCSGSEVAKESSSPMSAPTPRRLKNMRPTQVDLPPGNGRGIHLFEGGSRNGRDEALRTRRDGHEPQLPRAESGERTHLYSGNETERLGDNESGTVSAFAIDPKDRRSEAAELRPLRRQRPGASRVHPNGKHVLVANYFGGSVAVLPIKPMAASAKPRMSRRMRARSDPPRPPTPLRAVLPSAGMTRRTRT